MFDAFDYVAVNVSDMDRSVAFYRDAIGLELKFASPGWSEFETGRTVLALHFVKGSAPAVAEPVPGTAFLCLGTKDVDAVHAELTQRGVRFLSAPSDRPEEGIRLAIALDPDGLQIGIAQSLR